MECERLVKVKVMTEEKLEAKKNSKLNLTAEVQALSSEERIVKIAKEDLGMIRRTEPPIVVTVSKSKIEHISKILKKKYE